MAELDQADIETYVVARFAEWAGDFAYSRTQYAKFGRGEQYKLFPEKFHQPTDVIRFVSTLRAARLGEPTAEQTRELAAKVFPAEQEEKAFAAVEPLLLRPTEHLRAVVHRVGVRDFEMRGYLGGTSFERQLYANAAKLSDKSAPAPDQQSYGGAKSAYTSPGGEWVVEGVLFQQVTVSDFGLIKSDGRWTREEPPVNADEVLVPFQELLDALDPAATPTPVQEGQ